MYIESELIELKQRFSDSITKDIVAFLNTEGGTIIIGVTDDGKVLGVDKVDETFRQIADIVTEQIEPNPQESVKAELRFDEGKALIFVNILKGKENIYCIKKKGFSPSGCFFRLGTTARELTTTQIKIRYEKNFLDNEAMIKAPSRYAPLSFRIFKVYYTAKGYHLSPSSFEENFNLKTTEGRYNILAELISDKNNVPIIFVKFNGLNKANLSERSDYGQTCLLLSYENLKNRFIAENICLSDTSQRPRKDTYLYDINAVDEAIINALLHNDWLESEPLFSMFSDRIEILSHGGLPFNLTAEQFYSGVSKPRNSTLMRIFLNMDIAEHTGHGVPTIVEKYGKEAFEITDNYIKCTIPFNKEVLSKINRPSSTYQANETKLNKTEKAILSLLIEDNSNTTEKLSKAINVTQRTIERNLQSLKSKGYIERKGSDYSGCWIVEK